MWKELQRWSKIENQLKSLKTEYPFAYSVEFSIYNIDIIIGEIGEVDENGTQKVMHEMSMEIPCDLPF